jgi:hypothetical protein
MNALQNELTVKEAVNYLRNVNLSEWCSAPLDVISILLRNWEKLTEGKTVEEFASIIGTVYSLTEGNQLFKITNEVISQLWLYDVLSRELKRVRCMRGEYDIVIWKLTKFGASVILYLNKKGN